MNPSVSTLSASKVSSRNFRRGFWKAPLWAACMFVMVLLVSRAAYATTYTVTNTSDTNDGSCGSTCSLRDAINAATSGTDTIQFESGLVGVITLTSDTTLTISHDVTIYGPGAGLLTVSGNNAATVFTVSSGTVTVVGLTVANGSNNTYAGGITNGGALTVSDCAFANNIGGGIFNDSTGTLTVENSTFYGNQTVSTSIGGGGIFNVGSLTVSGSTFSNNSGANGGGIFNNIGNATVNNSTFHGNVAMFKGGGIENDGTMTVSNNTISGNTSGGVGGGIDGDVGTLTLINSIVAGNTGGDCNLCGTPPSNNLIGGDPKLGPLQYNGGITQSMMPLPGSAVIGAGLSSALTTDQRGFARPAGSGVASDLGAVQTSYLTVTNLNDSGAGSLRDAMTTAIGDGSGDIIFQSGVTGTITLASALPIITGGNLNIAGPGANLLTIFGTNSYVVFTIGNASAAVNLSGLTIAHGSTSSQGGGLSNSGMSLLENCAFVSNASVGFGGAIFNNKTLIVENSTFSGNYAGDGGGIYNQNTLLVQNSTFSGNHTNSGGNGGGIENSGNGTAVVEDSTFTGNTADNNGGGLDNISGSTLTVTNSIVAGNTATTGADCNKCTLNSPNLIGGPPNLSQLQLNGPNATVQTMLPLPGSPAIQAGDLTLLPSGLSTDERGFPRLTGTKLDLGAAQTNYTSVQFVQQPTNALINTDISPAVTAEVLETNTNLTAPNNTDPVSGIPITLTHSGSVTLNGTLAQTTTGGAATFSDLNASVPDSGDTLATSLTVVTGQTLTATSSPFDITLPIPTVNFSPGLPPATATYGNAPLTLKATTTYSGTPTNQTLSFQVDSGPATISGNVLTITGVGPVVVEVDAAANGSYGEAIAITNIGVNPAPLMVAADNATRTYGVANPAFTGTYGGEVNGDTFTVSGTTTATTTSAVGTYSITPTATGTNLVDYNVTYVPAMLTVTAATPTVSFTALPVNATYGEQINLSATATLSGTSTGQTVRYQVNSGPATISGNVVTITGVGTVQVEAFVAQSGNYSATNTTANITVTPTPLTLTIANATQTYGSPNHALFTATAVGLVNGDTLPGMVNYSTTATPTSSIGTYPITATLLGASVNNYILTVVPGTVTVTPATLTVTGTQQNSPYGTPNRTYYSSVTGQWNNDAFTVSYSTTPTVTQTSPVGTYTVVPTITGPNLADYSVVTTNGSLNIIPENLFVVAADSTRVYGTPNPAFSATVTGAVNGDTFSPTFTTVAQQNTDTGRYDIIPAVTSADIASYAVLPTVGILTITQASTSLALTASANDAAPGSPVTLTATATTAASGPPTGTVVFLANNTAIGVAQLNAQGVATLTLTYLPSGSNTITATYPQTRDFLGSTAQLAAPVLIGTPIFTMTTGTLSMAIQPGQEGTMTLTMTPLYGYAGTVRFNCNGLPAKSLCVFGPSSVTFDGSGTPVQVTLLMEIGELGLVKTSNVARLEPVHPLRGLPMLPAVIFWMPGAGLALEDKRKRSKRKAKSGRMLLLIALLAISAGVLGLAGCAGMSPYNSNNPLPGQQTVTITATGSGGITQSVAVQVIVE